VAVGVLTAFALVELRGCRVLVRLAAAAFVVLAIVVVVSLG
jgi:hypothetical protein